MTFVVDDDANEPEEDDQLIPLTQAERDDLTRDQNLFQKSLVSYWVHISKRKICCHQEQRSTGIETMREN